MNKKVWGKILLAMVFVGSFFVIAEVKAAGQCVCDVTVNDLLGLELMAQAQKCRSIPAKLGTVAEPTWIYDTSNCDVTRGQCVNAINSWGQIEPNPKCTWTDTERSLEKYKYRCRCNIWSGDVETGEKKELVNVGVMLNLNSTQCKEGPIVGPREWATGQPHTGNILSSCFYQDVSFTSQGAEGCYCSTELVGDTPSGDKHLIVSLGQSECVSDRTLSVDGTALYGCAWNVNTNISVKNEILPDQTGFPPLGRLIQTDLNVNKLLGRVVKTIMGVIGTVALLMFIYGGFTWMTALGNGEKEKKAFQIMVWAGLGVIVILSSYAIVKFVFEGIGFM